MLAALAMALLIAGASVLLGHALVTVLGATRFHHLSAAAGFAALVALAPFLIRLPARATTASVLLLAILVAAVVVLVHNHRRTSPRASKPRSERRSESQPASEGPVRGSPRSRTDGPEAAGDPLAGPTSTPEVAGDPLAGPTRARTTWLPALATVAIVIAAACIPFLANERHGVLGEGIYTNDHAAQLYWADWLQHGFGEEPEAVRFGYPVGPQALVAIVAQATGADLVAAFNGLLIAIAALTALTALAVLAPLPPARRVIAASLVALPYLAASFLAQSAFKETAMALLVVGLAIALRELGRRDLPRRAALAILALLAVAGVLAYSLPGLAWFALAGVIWLGLELAAGRRPPLRPIREALAGHRVMTIIAAVLALALLAVALGPALAFLERITAVQASAGRLSSPVFPGEALGVWPAGDFRLVRGDVPGAIPAAMLGFAALAFGVVSLVRRGEVAILATLAAAAGVYAGSRLFAEIHVQAKALAVMAPLVMLVSAGALLAPLSRRRGPELGRLAFGALFAAAAIASTFLALRAAPVGFDDRARGLERLGERIQGSSVAFLGVDRAAAYRLRGTEVRSPGGFVPPRVNARSRKPWRQGTAIDFDTLAPRKLDTFDYAITTTAGHQSVAPEGMVLVADDGDYALWRREAPMPANLILPEEGVRGAPGAELSCRERPATERFPPAGRATVRGAPAVGGLEGWSGAEPVDPRSSAAGQERAFLAPASAVQTLDLGPGRWALSLQYHSQAPLTVEVEGRSFELPPSLDGMYLDGAGQGAFWPAGEVDAGEGGPVAISVRAAEPSALQRALGVERRVWLGRIAADPIAEARTIPVERACGEYVDRILVAR